MKTLESYFKILVALSVGLFLMISCENSSDMPDEIQSISEEDNITLIESIDISDEVDDIIDEVIIEELSIANKEEASKDDKNDKNDKKGRPECIEKTVINDEIIDNTRIRTITLDFGDGCEMKKRHVLSGKITMVVVLDLDTKEKEVTHTYEEGFTVDDVLVSGTSIITRIRENGNGNPQRTVIFNKTLEWPDGKIVNRNGEKTREWIEGYNNKGWGDNVHLISGNWETTFYNDDNTTTIFSTVILTPLRREFSCKYIVSGKKTIEKGTRKGTVDFGNGKCDNKATFTPKDGEPVEFTLRKRKRNK